MLLLQYFERAVSLTRAACQEIYDGLDMFRYKAAPMIGLSMQEPKNLRREDVFRELGLVDVREDDLSPTDCRI